MFIDINMVNKEDYISKVPYNQDMIIEYREEVTDKGVVIRIPYIRDRSFVMQDIKLAYMIPLLSRSAILLINYIYIILYADTNTVYIDVNSFLGYSGLKKSAYYNAIKELLDKQIVFESGRKNRYIINIKYIFKGSIINYLNNYEKKF